MVIISMWFNIGCGQQINPYGQGCGIEIDAFDMQNKPGDQRRPWGIKKEEDGLSRKISRYTNVHFGKLMGDSFME